MEFSERERERERERGRGREMGAVILNRMTRTRRLLVTRTCTTTVLVHCQKQLFMKTFEITYHLIVRYIRFATREKGHSNICVKCRHGSACAVRAGQSETLLYDSVRLFAKDDLL